jgi:hypothetical protein
VLSGNTEKTKKNNLFAIPVTLGKNTISPRLILAAEVGYSNAHR